MAPQHTRINSEACWAACEWAISQDWLLNLERHIATGPGWGSCHTPLLCAWVRTCVGATKCISNCTEKLKHIYMHSGTVPTNTDTLSHSLSLSLLPCVSSFALSWPPFKEGPNFSLISFIKRCGEKRRKRRRREGESKKRLGGQIGERWMGYYTADCTI